jgi:hypothetical protein
MPRQNGVLKAGPNPQPRPRGERGTGSLTRRMIVISAVWIAVLLGGGGYALDRVLTGAVTRNFDAGLEYVMDALIASAEVGPAGEAYLNRPPADQRFLEPNSGLYFQITAVGDKPAAQAGDLDFPSRSLWDRRLQIRENHNDFQVHVYDSEEFEGETLRVVERDIRIPGSPLRWRFQVAQERVLIDEQISVLRSTLTRSFAILGIGLVILAALQAIYGLWPLRRVQKAIASIRSGERSRIDESFPREIEPLKEELNALLAHNENQAEDPAHSYHQRRNRQGPGPCRRRLPRSDDDAPAGGPPPCPRPRHRPPLLGPGPRPGLAEPGIGRAGGQPALRKRHSRSCRRQGSLGARRAPGSGRDARQPHRKRRKIWRQPRVRDRQGHLRVRGDRSGG